MKKDEILGEQSSQDDHDFMVDSIVTGLNESQRNQLLKRCLDRMSTEQLEQIAVEHHLV